MKRAEYRRMAELEEFYWWHVGRLSVVGRQLKRLLCPDGKPHDPGACEILNIGSGTGGTLSLLSRYGRVTNVDTSADAIRHMRRRTDAHVIKVKGVTLPFEDASFDIIAALDVLEHIEDEHGALAEWLRVLRPGGKLIITVPAYQWLWSDHDVSLHHHRRYTASRLHRVLARAGFAVEKRSYAIAFSFPLVVGYRLLRSVFPKKLTKNKKKDREHTSYVLLPAAINRFFIALLKLEAVILERFNLPFGTSVFTIASRDDSALVTTELRLLAASASRTAHTQPAHVHTTRTS